MPLRTPDRIERQPQSCNFRQYEGWLKGCISRINGPSKEDCVISKGQLIAPIIGGAGGNEMILFHRKCVAPPNATCWTNRWADAALGMIIGATKRRTGIHPIQHDNDVKKIDGIRISKQTNYCKPEVWLEYQGPCQFSRHKVGPNSSTSCQASAG
jgi:hypothetical protein